MRLKLQGKSLENEAKRLQKEAAKEKMKAKQAQKKGNLSQAKLFAMNAVRYEKQAQHILQSSATTNGYAVDIRNGAVAAQMYKNMNQATTGLEKNVKSIDVDKVSAQRTRMDKLKEQMHTASTLLNGEEDLGLMDGADALLEQLEMENIEDCNLNLAQIPLDSPPMDAGDIGDPNHRQNV